jgi:hypothetical protein
MCYWISESNKIDRTEYNQFTYPKKVGYNRIRFD